MMIHISIQISERKRIIKSIFRRVNNGIIKYIFNLKILSSILIIIIIIIIVSIRILIMKGVNKCK